MGAYLSEPVTEKISSDEANFRLECGASTMQGWRVNQEDAHNIILDFDINTSFFAVYDGHGGAEVALYSSQSLPNFIKNTEAYKKGDLARALEEAYLGFDATIPTTETMELLKVLAAKINPASGGILDNEMEEEEENVSNLFQEAKLPLQEVLAKYENNVVQRVKLIDSITPMSPFLRAKKHPGACEVTDEGTSACNVPGCSSENKEKDNTLGAGSSNCNMPGCSSENMEEAASSSKDQVAEDADVEKAKNGDEDAGVSSTNSNDDKDLNGEVSTSESEAKVVEKPTNTVPDSSEDNCLKPEQSAKVENVGSSEVCNGEVTESKEAAGEDDKISSSNGATVGPQEKSPVSSSEAQEKDPERPSKNKIRRSAAAVYKQLLTNDQEEESTDDDDDETFEGGEVDSSDEENVNGVSDSECEEDEGIEDETSEEDEDLSMMEEPGNDSGCTAVVALIKGNELYVANAGDSRCIVCRDGKAIDMSEDHKPEDASELIRITKAGGKVSSDGRINGGLNLSRAIGDHSYKQNKELGPKDQMITAFPDVKTLTIDPTKDQFMVLACDGIWNFMSSQDVCDFILPKLIEGRERLSQICEEMFDHCLAPNTHGDGTGCDNMTAILIRFKDGIVAEVAKTKKRLAKDEPLEETQDTKKPKLEVDSLSSSIVTSSV